MGHRPGHIDFGGDGTQSIDRRKYLGMLAAGAAFGTVAAGLAACGGSSTEQKESVTQDTTDHDHDQLVSGACNTERTFGILSLYPPKFTTIASTNGFDLSTLSGTIKVPFFNSSGIPIKEGQTVGFTLVRIGCPVKFVIATNFIAEDGHHTELPGLDLAQRNKNMDIWLMNNGYPETAWEKPDEQDCPPRSALWDDKAVQLR
jgi:hypothetical protein